MTKPIEKNFYNQLTRKDYFLYLLNRNVFITISPLIILSLIVVFIFMVNKDGFQTGDILYLLPILLFILSYMQMNNAIKKAIKENETISDLKVVIESKKYKEITSNGENVLEYSKCHSYYESKNYYYLYVDKVNALIIPKREFNSSELETIESYFNSSIKKTHLFNTRTILGLLFSIALVFSMITLIISMI